MATTVGLRCIQTSMSSSIYHQAMLDVLRSDRRCYVSLQFPHGNGVQSSWHGVARARRIIGENQTGMWGDTNESVGAHSLYLRPAIMPRTMRVLLLLHELSRTVCTRIGIDTFDALRADVEVRTIALRRGARSRRTVERSGCYTFSLETDHRAKSSSAIC